ncbi:MAG: PocR ligand-binding domain-containing protein [candidate division Zixibacteria bacterium]|nr:PocR ligand-binding domain-containing protein [candidate division Zixibacteria bacterium]
MNKIGKNSPKSKFDFKQLSNCLRYGIYGALFGSAFPAIVFVLELIFDSRSLSWSTVIHIHSAHPYIWIIETAPLFLGIFASLAGRRQDDISRLNNILEGQISEKMYELFVANKKIESQIKELDEAKQLLDDNAKHLRAKIDLEIPLDDDGEAIRLTHLIDVEHLQTLQDSIATAFDLSSVVIDIEGRPITRPSNDSKMCSAIRMTEVGSKRCLESDKELGLQAARLLKPSLKKCNRCSLLNAGAPIIVEGRHIGTWIIGQNPVGSLDKEQLEAYAQEVKLDAQMLEMAHAEMKRIPLHKFEHIVEFLWNFTNEISTLAFSNLELARELSKKRDIKLSESTGIILEKSNF